MKIYKEIKQKTNEWLELRKGKITASEFSDLVFKKGELTKTGISKLREIIADKYNLNNYTEKVFESVDIKRGNELEPKCRKEYERINNVVVEEVGFVEENKWLGCSPDGLVGEDGLLECKAPNNKNFISYVLGDINEDWLWQCKLQLYITKRKWCDLCLYNENYNKKTYIKRITLSEEDIKTIEVVLNKCIKTLEEYEVELKEYIASNTTNNIKEEYTQF